MPDAAVLDAPQPESQVLSREPSNEPIDDPFSKFEEPKPDKPAAKTPPEKKPEVKTDKPVVKEDKKAPAPADKKEEKEPDLDTGKMAPKALRDAYDKLKREHKERETRYTAELEAARKSSAPKEDPEKAELSTRYQDLEKRYKDLDGEMRYVNFQKSSEFQDKYYKPYEKQYKDAASKIMSWKAFAEEGETPRDVTAKDFEAFMGQTSDDDAEAFARKLFGSETKTTRAMTMRDEIIKAERTMREAGEEFRKTGEARHKEFQAQTEKQQQQLAEQWTKLNSDAIEKYPQWFKAEEGDEKGAELLQKGFELADLAFSGTSELPPEKMLALHSAIRNHAAGFRYMAHKFEGAQSRIAELEKELEQYKSSEPGSGAVRADKTSDADEDPFAKYDK